MKMMKLLAFFAFVGISQYLSAEPFSTASCHAEWNKPVTSVLQRLVVFRQDNLHVTDPATEIWGMEDAYTCGGTYVISKVKIKSQLPLQQVLRNFPGNALECATDGEAFSPRIPNFSVLRDALSSESAKGILEVRYENGKCQFDYFPSLQDYRQYYRDYLCERPFGSTPINRCQHVRRMRRSVSR